VRDAQVLEPGKVLDDSLDVLVVKQRAKTIELEPSQVGQFLQHVKQVSGLVDNMGMYGQDAEFGSNFKHILSGGPPAIQVEFGWL